MIDPAGDLKAWADLAIATAVLGGVVVGWIRYIRPRWRRSKAEVVAVRDAILGRDAVLDTITGEERVPALPGIGVRTAKLEQGMELLSVAVTKLADQNAALVSIGRDVTDLQTRVDRLEAAAVERVVAKVESTAAWSAVEAVANTTPTDRIPGDVPHE